MPDEPFMPDEAIGIDIDQKPVEIPRIEAEEILLTPNSTNIVPGYSRVINPEGLPEGQTVESVFALTALLAEAMHESENLKLWAIGNSKGIASVLGWNALMPDPHWLSAEGYIAAFVRRWKFRAAIRYGNLCAFLKDYGEFGFVFRGIATGREAEALIAADYKADSMLQRYLDYWATAAREAVGQYYRKQEDTADTRPDVPPLTEEEKSVKSGRSPLPEHIRKTLTRHGMNPLTMNMYAALNLSGQISIGDLMSSIYVLNRRFKIDTHDLERVQTVVELREEMDDTLARGLLAMEKKEGAYLLPVKPAPTSARSIICPVCLYRMKARRSLAMDSGVNRGRANCAACDAPLELRAFSGSTLDTSGDALLAFREGEAPNEENPGKYVPHWARV